jgi:DNA-binding response OmpR family regulator
MMDKSKIKILVVDDYEDITHYTTKILRLEGFTVFGALDGPSALEIFHKEHPHICIVEPRFMEIKFTEIKPGRYLLIDGMDVLREIRETDRNVICIAVTRMKNDETRLQVIGGMGVDLYLLKPTDVWKDKVFSAAEVIQKSGGIESNNNS